MCLVPNFTPVDVTVDVRSADLTYKKMQSLCMSLADVCGIGDHELGWFGHRENKGDTVTFLTVLPNKCLRSLRSRLDRNRKHNVDKILQELKILNIDILSSDLEKGKAMVTDTYKFAQCDVTR